MRGPMDSLLDMHGIGQMGGKGDEVPHRFDYDAALSGLPLHGGFERTWMPCARLGSSPPGLDHELSPEGEPCILGNTQTWGAGHETLHNSVFSQCAPQWSQGTALQNQ